MKQLRQRLWLLAPVTLTLVLLTTNAHFGGQPGAPVVAPTGALTGLATLTPEPTPTGGWWDQVTLTPPPRPALPKLPAVSLDGVSSGGIGSSAPTPVKFTTVSCPGPAKITRIMAARPGWWEIYGTAVDADLDYWKTELSSAGQNWTLLYRQNASVQDGKLMAFNTRTVPKGSYQLRLLVVNRTGNYAEPCVIQITTN